MVSVAKYAFMQNAVMLSAFMLSVVAPITILYSWDGLQALPSNIRQGGKLHKKTTLNTFNSNTAVKSFEIQTPRVVFTNNIFKITLKVGYVLTRNI